MKNLVIIIHDNYGSLYNFYLSKCVYYDNVIIIDNSPLPKHIHFMNDVKYIVVPPFFSNVIYAKSITQDLNLDQEKTEVFYLNNTNTFSKLLNYSTAQYNKFNLIIYDTTKFKNPSFAKPDFVNINKSNISSTQTSPTLKNRFIKDNDLKSHISFIKKLEGNESKQKKISNDNIIKFIIGKWMDTKTGFIYEFFNNGTSMYTDIKFKRYIHKWRLTSNTNISVRDHCSNKFNISKIDENTILFYPKIKNKPFMMDNIGDKNMPRLFKRQ